MKYNRNVRPKHIKEKHKGNYPDTFSYRDNGFRITLFFSSYIQSRHKY